MSYDFDETHKKILESALKTFMQKGFREASIRTICNKAGVTNGAFYAHFNSKEDLFASLVQPALDQLIFLYTKETIHFGKINSSNDILKAFSKTFSSQEVIIHFIYKNKDLFHLLLICCAICQWQTPNLIKKEKVLEIKIFGTRPL